MGGTISPGNSVGTLTTGTETWAAGGRYLFEIASPGTAGRVNAGVPGTHWDFLQLGTEVLTVTATGNGPTAFTVALSGDRAGWAEGTYDWVIASAGSVTGSDISTDNFLLDTAGLLNRHPSDTLAISSDGTNVILSYTAVPEPSALALIAGAGLLATRRRRRATVTKT